MRHCHQKIIRSIQRLIVYLIEDVRLASYGLFLVLGILVVSCIYYFLTPYSHGIGSNGLPLESITFWDSLYFSAVTVSSLGYGDMHPMGISKFFACAEVLVGLIFMGIILAKMTSARLSYHVARLFSSETQKRLEEFAEDFERLQSQLMQTTKMLGQAFQNTPGSPVSQDNSIIIEKFSSVSSFFYSRSKGITEYLSYEVEHGDFFKTASINGMKRTAETIEQALFLLGQIILSMSAEARALLLKSDNIKRILEALKEQRRTCNIVYEHCKDESVRQKFAEIIQTCNNLPESFFTTPVAVAKAEQPDQKLESTDQPRPDN